MVWMSVWKVANSLSNSEIVFHLHTYNIRLSVHMHILHIHFLCLVNVYKSEKFETELFVNTTQTSAQTVPIGQFSVQISKMPGVLKF